MDLSHVAPVTLFLQVVACVMWFQYFIHDGIRREGALNFADRLNWMFPPLPQAVFRNTSVAPFEWTHILRSNYKVIQSELEQFRSANPGVLETQKVQLALVSREYDESGWASFFLRCFGHESTYLSSLFPRTMELLQEVDASVSMPCVQISALAPGQSLPRHHDHRFKGMLRYHLALSIPPHSDDDLYLTVYSEGESEEVVRWSNGSDFLFDPSNDHEVTNHAEAARIVLMAYTLRQDVPFWLNALNEMLLWISVKALNQCPNVLLKQDRFLREQCLD